jgi:transcription elongation factor GreB
MTLAGYGASASAELDQLVRDERPRIVQVVSWAASNGDRSENGDYIYGKKRLREMDKRIRFLIKRLEIGDRGRSTGSSRRTPNSVFFGATVTISEDDDRASTKHGADRRCR